MTGYDISKMRLAAHCFLSFSKAFCAIFASMMSGFEAAVMVGSIAIPLYRRHLVRTPCFRMFDQFECKPGQQFAQDQFRMFRYFYRARKTGEGVLSVLPGSGYTGRISSAGAALRFSRLELRKSPAWDREPRKPIKALTADQLHRPRCRGFTVRFGCCRFVRRHQPAPSAEDIGLQKLQIE